MGVKRGSPRKHTQSVQRPERWPGPRPQGHFENSSGFTIKVKFQVAFFVREKFATVKIRVWRFWTHFPIVLKWPSKKMFCWLIFVHVFTCTMNRIKESNEWIESMNGSNESNQWIESTNRINESNHWVERQDKKLWLYTSGDFLNRF